MSGHSKWANIKHKKGKADAARGAATTKISREITTAVRLGGADPTGNMRLKLALQKARENNIPKDNIQRAIQKGQGALEGASYEEVTYEGYGTAGVALLVEAMTDNRNRMAAEMRHIFSKHGGNMGESGCVSWMFHKKGLVLIDKATGLSEEDLLAIVLEAGAEDMDSEGEQYEVTCAPDDFEGLLNAMENAGVKWDSAEISMIPETSIALDGDDAAKLMRLVDALEEQDDVQNVYGNFDVPDEDEDE
ncbi:MAG: YebC/PmpR family DNA-binding transcriptional regulator [Veillonellaceae bacterium]|nr:YebC/PmpR family DNA-binding transcriptional regulator [Veillonellaceae bacterium]